MQRTLTLDDRSFSVVEASTDSFCLVCEATLNCQSSTNIFYASLPRNGELLASFVLRVLRPVASDLRSSYICSRCNELFHMLEQAQWTVANIRCEILKVYHARANDEASERKCDLPQAQLLPDDLFAVTDRKTAFDSDRFDEIGEFGTQNVEPNENVTRNCAFDVAPNEFCNFNIEIDNVDDKPEESLEVGDNADNKINCALNDEQHVGNVARSEMFNNEANDYRNGNHTIEDCEKKLEETLEICRDSVYEGKYDCLEIKQPLENVYESEDAIESKNCTKNHHNLIDGVSNDPSNNTIDKTTVIKNVDLSATNDRTTSTNPSMKNFNSKSSTNVIENFNPDESQIFEDSEKNVKTQINVKKDDSCKSERISKYSLKPLKHACTICGKKWRTSAELKTHVKSHSNLRPYMCEKCGQAYKHKHALEIHVGMHNGISPYRCNVCDKCFTQKGALMRHLPMHTGEMPYQCELCGKRFVHHTSYNMHALSHTGKKSYQCHVCDLSLLSTSHLKRHMRVHTGEKPYSCELCGKSFAERYNLFAHQKIHDPAEIMAKAAKKITYKCEQCDGFFDKKHKLEDHTKERHGGATNDGKWIGHTVDVENLANTSVVFAQTQKIRTNYN